MSSSKVLTLQFACDNGKKYSIRVKDADENVNPDLVKELADTIVKSKAFDFDGKQTPYHLNSATYTTTDKKALIAAK